MQPHTNREEDRVVQESERLGHEGVHTVQERVEADKAMAKPENERRWYSEINWPPRRAQHPVDPPRRLGRPVRLPFPEPSEPDEDRERRQHDGQVFERPEMRRTVLAVL